MKTSILTFAGTWYPDKTTSSSKNLALPVILGVSLERVESSVHVKQSTESCYGQKKLHRVIYSSSRKMLIIVDYAYKGFSYISFVSRLSL